MQVTDREVAAARELGEAFLRFIVAVEGGSRSRRPRSSMESDRAVSHLPSIADQSSDSGQLLLTATDAARMLSMGRTNVYGLMETGQLPYVKIGRCRRIRLTEILKLVEANTVSRV